MATEEAIGKVAALCCRALFEFLGHLVELLFRALTALVGIHEIQWDEPPIDRPHRGLGARDHIESIRILDDAETPIINSKTSNHRRLPTDRARVGCCQEIPAVAAPLARLSGSCLSGHLLEWRSHPHHVVAVAASPSQPCSH